MINYSLIFYNYNLFYCLSFNYNYVHVLSCSTVLSILDRYPLKKRCILFYFWSKKQLIKCKKNILNSKAVD